jgi:hypothetical protein
MQWPKAFASACFAELATSPALDVKAWFSSERLTEEDLDRRWWQLSFALQPLEIKILQSSECRLNIKNVV